MDITVITPTLPERHELLLEAADTVAAQTLPAAQHLVGIDPMHAGPAAVRNALIDACATEWVAFLDDDDLLDPHHLQLLAEVARRDGVDVAGSYCRFSDETIPDKFCNRPYHRGTLRLHGIFPITVLARRSAVLAAGGFGDERYEDWELWNRMADNGCTFTIEPVVTWTYRLRAENRTFAPA